MPYTFEQLMVGFRAAITRADMRAEQIVVSPGRMKLFLDLIEKEINKYKGTEDRHPANCRCEWCGRLRNY